jgi:hypothetical protein
MLTPVRLPFGRARLVTRPRSTGSLLEKTIGIVEVALFAASAAGGAPAGHDHIDMAGDKVRRQCRKLLIASVGPAVFHCHVSSVGVAGFGEALVERGDVGRIWARRGAAEIADHGHRLLLGARRQRPCERRAADKLQQLTASHSLTSSAVNPLIR